MAEENQNPSNPQAQAGSPAGGTPQAQPSSPPANQPQPAPNAGDTVTRSEHQRLLEKARSDEKQKQFDVIAEKDRLIAEAKQENQRLQSQLDALAAAATPNSGVDVKKVIEDVTRSTETVYRTSMDEMRNSVEKLEKQLRNAELGRFREKAIADAGGPSNLIVSLVRGNTEEEITASVEEAKQEFERIRQRINPGSSTPVPPVPATPQNTSTVTPPPTVTPVTTGPVGRGAGNDAIETVTGGKSVRELSREEYAAKRGELQRSIRDRYKPQPVR